ncbi:MAG: site-specific integrase [Bacteroidales bacterium]|nr:site-specific integrase [Bacteroidales bacterium]
MANLKIIHFTSKKLKDKTSPVLLRLTIDRKVRNFRFPDNFHCLKNQWNKNSSCFKTTYPNYDKANRRLDEALSKAREICMELNRKNNDKGFTHDEFVERFKESKERLMLFKYFDEIYNRLIAANKVGNAATYLDTKNQFVKFLETDIEMKNLTLKKINQFVEQCQSEGQKDTSISVRLRTLRALFNKARKEEGLENYPFEKFDWSQLNLQTEKRAISKTDLLKIYHHEIEQGKPGFDSRNYWILSYLCFGLNFIDLAKLEPKNISTDEGQKILVYYRSKTKRIVRVPLSEQALKIIDIYTNQNFGSKYIFPILNQEIHQSPQQIKTRIKTALKKVNEEMNDIAAKLEIDKRLTSYVARHSFATILKKEMIPTAIISEMMAHANESVTQTYLDSFDNSTKTAAAAKLI